MKKMFSRKTLFKVFILLLIPSIILYLTIDTFGNTWYWGLSTMLLFVWWCIYVFLLIVHIIVKLIDINIKN
ncbi:MAG: hypothetical protein CSA38_00645 [Flavobacteriales bacterium]|nr:MAG: hypothetical protein CSA38_00645 [Flavobacteriales bacterium]